MSCAQNSAQTELNHCPTAAAMDEQHMSECLGSMDLAAEVLE